MGQMHEEELPVARPIVRRLFPGAGSASCYYHRPVGGGLLPLLPSRRRGLGRGGPFYWMPLSPSLSPLVPRGARENKISGGCDKMRRERCATASRPRAPPA